MRAALHRSIGVFNALEYIIVVYTIFAEAIQPQGVWNPLKPPLVPLAATFSCGPFRSCPDLGSGGELYLNAPSLKADGLINPSTRTKKGPYSKKIVGWN